MAIKFFSLGRGEEISVYGSEVIITVKNCMTILF